jgi:hypothetical protein
VTAAPPRVTEVVCTVTLGLSGLCAVPGGGAADCVRNAAVIVSVVAVAFGCDPFAVMTIVSELSEPKSTLNNRPGVSAALPILALDV